MAKKSRLAQPQRHKAIRQLDRIQAELDQLRAMLETFDPTLPPEEVSVEWVKGIISSRRRRQRITGSKLFQSDPWDMLLELYAAKLANERVSVNHLAKVAGVPSGSASRWVGDLESAGLVVRTPDSEDRRRVFVKLSPTGLAALSEYFGKPLPGDIPT